MMLGAIIALSVLAAILAAACAVLFFERRNLKADNAELTGELAEAEQQRDQLRDSLHQRDNELTKLTEQLHNLEQQQSACAKSRDTKLRDAPTTCPNVFSTGLYMAAAGAAAGATTAAAAAAGQGGRPCSGSDQGRTLRSSPQANVEIAGGVAPVHVGEAGSVAAVGQAQAASLRSRHSSPPTAGVS